MTGSKTLQEITPLLIGVQSNPERDVSLASLAAEHGYSPSHFHRVFTEVVDETPKAHVERVRLERAAYRLSVTAESILDIALSIGFRTHETFTRAFRRRFNKTPSEWRRLSIEGQKTWVPAVGATIPGLLRTEATKETMVYFGVDDVKATLDKVVANGGKIHTPRYEVKGVVILGLLIDPAGNRVGVVEMKDGKAIVP